MGPIREGDIVAFVSDKKWQMLKITYEYHIRRYKNSNPKVNFKAIVCMVNQYNSYRTLYMDCTKLFNNIKLLKDPKKINKFVKERERYAKAIENIKNAQKEKERF